MTVASDNTDVTADTSTTTGIQTTLAFSTTSWNTARTVTVAAAGDAGSADETATLSHTATGGGYASVTHGVFVAVQDDEQTGTDYDTDEDGLIEISSVVQLNAMRWDPDGNGVVTSGNTANYTAAGAFSNAATGMGCPDGSDSDDEPDACTGYELASDLDFDTDGSGATHTGGVRRCERHLLQRRQRLVADRQRQRSLQHDLQRQRPRHLEPVQSTAAGASAGCSAPRTRRRSSCRWVCATSTSTTRTTAPPSTMVPWWAKTEAASARSGRPAR